MTPSEQITQLKCAKLKTEFSREKTNRVEEREKRHMDGRGGCCIARYSGADAYGYDISKFGRIMLRFRPIAPKPVPSDSVSGGANPDNGENHVRGGRGKRKYVKDNGSGNGGKRCNNKKRSSKQASPDHENHHDVKKPRGVLAGEETVVTLPLLPETPEPKDSPARISPETKVESPMWLSFENFTAANNNNNNNNMRDQYGSCGRPAAAEDPTVKMAARAMRLVGSSVTVECVMDTWTDGNGLGCTDEERRMNLQRDTCPGFTSDGFGRVTWTNGAYRKMVGLHGGDGTDDDQMMVWLVMKERLPAAVLLTSPAFTCRVRLQYYTNGNYKEVKSSLTLPCDVWRMDGGGFAWRLDVKAALSLGW